MLLSHPYSVVLDVLVRERRQQKKTKGAQQEKKKSNPIADYLNPYISDPKDTTKYLLELINVFSAVVVYGINSQRSVAYLYMNNRHTEREAIAAVLNNRIHKTVECIM